MPPEMGLSGPRMKGCAGASPSVFTAGPPSEAGVPATATGRPGLGATPLSSDASTTGAAPLTRLLAGCGAGLTAAADGLGCDGALACAFELAREACGCAGLPCAAGDDAGCAAGCDIEAGCDIFAIIAPSR